MSQGFQSVNIVGRLGKDPEARATQSGTKITTFSVAVSEGSGEKQTTEWFNVVTFGTTAENAAKYLKKGKQVGILGKSKTSSWDDKATGQKKYKVEIIASSVQYLDDDKSGSGGRSESAPKTRTEQAPQTRAAQPSVEDSAYIQSEDLPF